MYAHASQPSVFPPMRKCVRAACIVVFLCQSVTASTLDKSLGDSWTIDQAIEPTDNESILNPQQTAHWHGDQRNECFTQAWHETTTTAHTLHGSSETEKRADREIDFDEGAAPDMTLQRDTVSTACLQTLVDFALLAPLHVDYTLLEESEEHAIDPLSLELQLLSLNSTKTIGYDALDTGKADNLPRPFSVHPVSAPDAPNVHAARVNVTPHLLRIAASMLSCSF